MLHRTCSAFVLLLLSVAPLARAATLTGRLAQSGLAMVALEPDGRAVSSTAQTFSLTTRESAGRLVVLSSDTTVHGPVVLAIRSKNRMMPVAQALRKGACATSDARAVLRFRAKGRKPLRLGTIALGASVAYPTRKVPKKALDVSTGLAAAGADRVPVGAGRLGIVSGEAAVRAAVVAAESAPGPGPGPEADRDGEADLDGDGMPNAFDADDDGDQVLDNDDPDSSGPRDPSTPSFWVFSNFHQDFEHSLNANAMTVTKALVDAAPARANRLSWTWGTCASSRTSRTARAPSAPPAPRARPALASALATPSPRTTRTSPSSPTAFRMPSATGGADPANTFTYSLNLSACLATAGLSWNAGEALMVPVQMMNVYVDNAAQNVFFVRDDA
jgi:hypothetical protein